MKNERKNILIIFLLLVTMQQVVAQEGIVKDSVQQRIDEHINETPFYAKSQLTVNEEDVLKIMDMQPAFGVYKDTYFITGVPLNTSINKHTADALFQISIRHRLTKSRLPFNSFLYLTYTQRSFWDIYAESAPFRDSNYNPSIGVGKYIIQNNKLMGAAFLQIEHESNGREGDDSRSWNLVSLSSKYFFNMQLSIGLKVWIPFVDGEENEDLIDYRGYGMGTINYTTKNKHWWFTVELNPRKGWGNVNTSVSAGYKISKNDNQYLYTRFFNGKGDSLLDYDKYNMNIRLGLCIKPDFNSIF